MFTNAKFKSTKLFQLENFVAITGDQACHKNQMLSFSLVLYLWSWQIYVFDIKIKPNRLPLSVHKILVDLW